MQVDGWRGRPGRLEQIYIDALKFDDHLVADFLGPAGERVGLYIAWYGSQQKGASVHSPRTCIPGGGWEIAALEQRTVDGVVVNGAPLQVNRVLIQKGDDRQLVYYWFQQRGRVLSNEYLVKWYLFVDALTRQRTDGSLVRITTVLPPAMPIERADAQLAAFAATLAPRLAPFVPD
jgi:EpsI family protein